MRSDLYPTWTALGLALLLGLAGCASNGASTSPTAPVTVTDVSSVAGRWAGLLSITEGRDREDYVEVIVDGNGAYQASAARTIGVHAQRQLLDVEDDVDDVFANAFQRRELVDDAVDLDGRHRRALQGRQQHAAQGVADGVAVTGFKGFGDELGVGFRGGCILLGQPFGHSKRPRRTGIFSFQQF